MVINLKTVEIDTPGLCTYSHDSGSVANTHGGSSTEEAWDSIGGCSSGQGVPDSPNPTRD